MLAWLFLVRRKPWIGTAIGLLPCVVLARVFAISLNPSVSRKPFYSDGSWIRSGRCLSRSAEDDIGFLVAGRNHRTVGGQAVGIIEDIRFLGEKGFGRFGAKAGYSPPKNNVSPVMIRIIALNPAYMGPIAEKGHFVLGADPRLCHG